MCTVQGSGIDTALHRVHSDIHVVHAIDDKNMCPLVLLDLVVAFDTIDKDILLARL